MKIEPVNQRLDKIDKRLESVETNVKRLDRRLGIVESDVEIIKKGVIKDSMEQSSDDTRYAQSPSI